MNLRLLFIKDVQHVVVHQMYRSDSQLVGVKPCEGVAQMVFYGALQIDISDAFEHAYEVPIDSYQSDGVGGFYLSFSDIGREAFDLFDLFLRQLYLVLCRGLF